MARSLPVASALEPVFILGSHRSGTTWLHQLVAELGEFDYLSAYQVIQYNRLPPAGQARRDDQAYRELRETFSQLEINGSARMIDEIEVSPELPEEYGFVLDNAGTGLTVVRKNLPLLEQLIRRVQRSPTRPVVLKSAWDYANFVYLHRVFPRARFIFIHRHPERVVQSLLSTVRRVIQSRIPYLALLSPSYARQFSGRPLDRMRAALARLLTTSSFAIGLRLATQALAHANRYYVANIHRLPPKSYLSIRYEDLCAQPDLVFGRVLSFLGLDPTRASKLGTQARPRHLAVPLEVQRHRALIARKTAAYMELHGYAVGGQVMAQPSSPPAGVRNSRLSVALEER